MPFGLDAATLGIIASGVASAIGGIVGNRSQSSGIQNALATQATGNTEAQKVMWDMYQQGRADLAPYRSVGKSSLKQLEYLTYGKNLSDFSDAAPAGTGYGSNALGGGPGQTLSGVPNVQPGSTSGAVQFGTTPTYQPGKIDTFKGLLGSLGAGLGAGGLALAGGVLGSGTLTSIGLTALSGPFMPILLGLGYAASQLFGRHNDDKAKATQLAKGLSKLVWGDNLDGKGGLSGAIASGAITPDQGQQIFNEWFSEYPNRMKAAGVDDTTIQNTMKSQFDYSKDFPRMVGDYKTGKIKSGPGNPFLPGAQPTTPTAPVGPQAPSPAVQQSQAYREELFGGARPPAPAAPAPPLVPKTNVLAPPPAPFAPVNQRQMGQPMASMQATDTVPAMLQPKEYVLTPQAADLIGRPNLDRLNSLAMQGGMQRPGIPPQLNPLNPIHFATGGTVPKAQDPNFTLQNGYYIRKGAENMGITPEFLASNAKTNDPYQTAQLSYEKQRAPGLAGLGDPHSKAAQDYLAGTNTGVGNILAHQAIPQNLLPAGGFKPAAPLPPVPRISTGGIGGTPVNITPPVPPSVPPIQTPLASSIAPPGSLGKFTVNPPNAISPALPTAPPAAPGVGTGTSAFYPYGGGGFRAMTPEERQAAGIPGAAQLTPQQAQSFGMHVPANSPLYGNNYPAPFPNTSTPGTTGGVTPVPTGGPPGGIPPPSQYGNYPVGYIPTHLTGPEGTDYTTSPLYQLQLREGEKNLDRWLLAHGRANSTYATQAHNALSENLLANEADKIYQRVQYLTGLGYGAAGQSSQSSQNFGQQLSNMILMNALNQGGLQMNQGQNNATLANFLGNIPKSLMAQLLPYLNQQPQSNPLAPSPSYTAPTGTYGPVGIEDILNSLGR